MGLSSQDENSFGLNAFLLWFLDLRYREFRLSSDCHHIHQFTVYCLLRSMQGSFLFYLSSFIPFSLQVSSPITGNHPNILDVYIIQYILVLICILVKSGLLFFLCLHFHFMWMYCALDSLWLLIFHSICVALGLSSLLFLIAMSIPVCASITFPPSTPPAMFTHIVSSSPIPQHSKSHPCLCLLMHCLRTYLG